MVRFQERRLAFRYKGFYEIAIEKVKETVVEKKSIGVVISSTVESFWQQQQKIPSQIGVTTDCYGFHTDQTVRFLSDVAYQAAEASTLIKHSKDVIKSTSLA